MSLHLYQITKLVMVLFGGEMVPSMNPRLFLALKAIYIDKNYPELCTSRGLETRISPGESKLYRVSESGMLRAMFLC